MTKDDFEDGCLVVAWLVSESESDIPEIIWLASMLLLLKKMAI